MNQPLTWIVGRRGLLGSALERALAQPTFRPVRELSWAAADIGQCLRAAAREFAALTAGGQRAWRVCWCAGVGVVGTHSEQLARETRSLGELLAALEQQPELVEAPGVFLLASSAGGIYAGARADQISEATEVAPLSHYGAAKLEQEELLRQRAGRFAGLSSLTARLSNLYGPGQRLDKAQGLISRMAQALVRGEPVQIYVPLDTIRDYLFAEDAGRMLQAGLARLAELPVPTHVLKIYGSERETSIASLLGVFRAIGRKQLRVVSGLHAVSAQHPRRMVFRSGVWSNDRRLASTGLVVGVGQVHRHSLRQLQAGSLPRSPYVAAQLARATAASQAGRSARELELQPTPGKAPVIAGDDSRRAADDRE